MSVFVWLILIAAFAVIVFEITCISIVFNKAGKPSWGCLIPVYGIMLLCDIAGKPRWWTLLCLVPLVNIAVYVILTLAAAKNFEGNDGSGAGHAYLPVIIYAMLAFGDFDYSPFDPEEITLAKKASVAPTVTRPQKAVAPAAPAVARPQQAVAMAAPAATHPQPAVAMATSAVARPQKAAPSSSDSVKQHPQIAKCPFCRSRTFSVVEEAGSRRCSNCHSVLPAYIQGNE